MKKNSYLNGSAFVSVFFLAGMPAFAQEAPEAASVGSQVSAVGPQEGEPEIIVTGMLNSKSVEKAPISITALSKDQIQQQGATSTAEILKAVPGVFVNSAFGENRAVLFSRGVSANSSEAANGYYYVSLQEDGLPIENITNGNFGPDYFSRPDLMLDHVEALRGGTAAITGPNAPGGIFNYISRNGKSNPGTEIQLKGGLEADGRNPYGRIDGYSGGQIGSSDVYYAVGGFYRKSDGARDAGYPQNHGGQIRSNLLWKYDAGSLQLSGKYLNDHSGFPEFLPAFNYKNPKIAKPFNNLSSVLPPDAPHEYTASDGTVRNWDPRDLVHSKSTSFSLEWKQDISDDFQLTNKARYSDNRTVWNTGELTNVIPINDSFGLLFLGASGIPGTLNFYNRGDRSLAASLTSGDGANYTVTQNNMPNQSIAQNGIISQTALNFRFHTKEFQDQVTLTGKIGNHSVAVGAYMSLNTYSQTSDDGGTGLSSLTSKPQLYDVTLTTPNGTIYQVTDPMGWGNYDGLNNGNRQYGRQNSFAFYVGDTWQVTPQFSIEGGLRYEIIDYHVNSVIANGSTNDPLTSGGADGNPLTLYDNRTRTFADPVLVARSFNYLNWTASASYEFSRRFQVYVRYTQSKKAPDWNTMQTLNTPALVAAVATPPQRVQQAEVGIKFNAPGLSLQAYPFYSKLSNVSDFQSLQDENGLTYVNAPVFGTNETYGIEFQGNVDVTDQFNIYTALTLQNPKGYGYSVYDAGPTASRDDDVLTRIPKGDADNNPKIIARATATYRPTDTVSLFGTYSYLGKRAANRYNAFYLPGFSTVDLGASYMIGGHLRIQANVNNVLNNYGIMSWSGSGGFLESLNRQALTKEQVASDPTGQLFSVITTPARSFWLTMNYSF